MILTEIIYMEILSDNKKLKKKEMDLSDKNK